MPDAHVTVQPSGQVIATTGSHRLTTRSRPRKGHHCSSPTATPVARPVMSRAPIPVPAPVSNAPRASPIATPKAVAKIHSGPTLMYLRSTNHWAAPITAPARAPPSAPDTTPSTEPTSTNANHPPSGKPKKASIHHRKKRHPPVRGTSLSVTTDGAAVPCVAISLPPKPRRASPCVSRVAGPSLEGGQVAVLHLHMASARSRNEGIILPSYGSECALWHQNTRRSTIEAPNFRELRKAEVRTIHIP